MNSDLLIYAKNMLLFCIHDTEVFEKLELNEERIKFLKTLRVSLRDLLQYLSF